MKSPSDDPLSEKKPPPFKTVFLMHHVHLDENESEDVKVIGVFSTESAAKEAAERLKAQPGFSQFPRIIDRARDEEGSGFIIEEYIVDLADWSEGFVTAHE